MSRLKNCSVVAMIRPLLTMVVPCCLGLLAYGCATLYVQPTKTKQGSMEVTVAVGKPKEPNGLAIIGFPPKTIRIIPKRAGQWLETVDVNLEKNQYKHTFDDIEAFKIDKNGLAIAFSVGKGAGPYKMPSPHEPITAAKPQKKDKYTQKYQNEELGDYRLVIELYPLSPSNRDKFLQGFKTAYIQTNEDTLGENYVNILKQSLAGGVYEQAFELGKRHAKSQVTDELVQTTIGRSLGLGGFELGWKAGYIEGFVQGRFETGPHDKETLYQKAEAMYNALRAAL